MNRRRTLSRWIRCGFGTCLLGGSAASSETKNNPHGAFRAIKADDNKPTGKSDRVVLIGDPIEAGMAAIQVTFKAWRSFIYRHGFGPHGDGAHEEEAVVRIYGMGPVISVNLEQSK